MNFFITIWYQRSHPVQYLLLPLSWIYQSLIQIRKLCYQLGLKKITRFSVPVIVVGNLTVGGTGKTPMVIWLAEWLKQQGYKPGIVSRGYGGKTKLFPQFVNANSHPQEVGEEPVLIAMRTNCPVVIDPNRVQAIHKLLAETDCTIVISDDGLQHYAMGRDIEIVMVDSERKFGNKHCLPAGPLREPLSRLKTVDFKVIQGQGVDDYYSMQLIPNELYNLKDPQKNLELSTIQQPVHAVAAIGNPTKFFKTLKQMGLNIIEHPYPDHYFFKADELNFGENEIVIMTEKDAVKYQPYAAHNYWCLKVSAMCDVSLQKNLLAKLH